MIAILTSKLGLAGIALALVLGVFGVQAFRLHHADAQIASMQAAQKVAEADVKAHEASASAISSKASSDLSAAQVQVVTKYRTLVQRVAVDVPEGADRDCVVPKGFVSLWNAGVQP